jgi:hypothetical protein
MRFAVSLATLVLTFAVYAADPKTEAPKPRPGLRSEHIEWITEGKGKLTEAEVLSKLGSPDEICLVEQPRVIPDGKKTWLDVNRIEVDFVDGKASRIAGRFSPVSPAADLNEEVLRKLKAGMTAQEVEKLVGSAPGEKVKHKDEFLGIEADRHVWQKQRILSVVFEKGKVVGWEYKMGFNDKRK